MVGNVAYLKGGLSCQDIYDNDYLKAIEDMKSMQFGFNDVRILLLQPNIHVLLNMLGLHYCIKQLGVQVDSVVEAISSCNIQDRDVHIHGWKKGTWLDPVVLYSRLISLKELTADEGQEKLSMLEEGETCEWVYQVSVPKSEGAVVI